MNSDPHEITPRMLFKLGEVKDFGIGWSNWLIHFPTLWKLRRLGLITSTTTIYGERLIVITPRGRLVILRAIAEKILNA